MSPIQPQTGKKHPIYKLGNLVYCGSSTQDLPKGYGIIIDIVDNITNEHYNESIIITGHGKKNTNVTLHIKIICKCGDDIWSSAENIEMLKEPIFTKYNPHWVFKISKKAAEKRYKSDLEKMNTKLDFIKKYSITRDEKINKIING